MTKRMMSLLLAGIVLLGMIPAVSLTAKAANTGVYVAGVEMANGSYLANGATETTTTKPSGGYAYYADGVLTLNNYEYEATDYMDNGYTYSIVYAGGDLEILLQGENRLVHTCEDTMCIATTGELNLSATEGGAITLLADGWGINAGGEMIVHGGDITVSSQYAGVEAWDLLTVNGGNLKITAKSHGISAISGMMMNGGSVTASSEGIAINLNNYGMQMNGGAITITDSVFSIYGGKDIYIGDGEITISDTEVGICTSGDITVDGGSLNVVVDNWALISFAGEVIINGGLLDLRSTNVNGDENMCVISPALTLDPTLEVQAATESDGELELYDPERLAEYNRIVVSGESLGCRNHDYGEWFVVAIPTCQEYGKIGKKCQNCDHVAYEKVQMIQHVYIPEVTAPTATEQGYTTYTCYFCQDSYVGDYVPALTGEAKIGTTVYATVEDAMNAAKSGDTVELLKDVQAGSLMVRSGVTLHVGGYSLTVQYLIALEGSTVTGNAISADGTAGGKIYVDKNNIALTETAPTSGSNYVLPVWNGDHFIFSLFNLNTASGGCGFAVSDDGDSLVLNFQHLASGYVQKNMLYNGGTDNCVSVVVEAAWENDVSYLSQRFVFTDVMVGKVAVGVNGVNYMYKAELTGCSAMRNLVIRALIVTDCGVCVVSETFEV